MDNPATILKYPVVMKTALLTKTPSEGTVSECNNNISLQFGQVCASQIVHIPVSTTCYIQSLCACTCTRVFQAPAKTAGFLAIGSSKTF